MTAVDAVVDPTLTTDEKACNFETMQHIHTVGHYVNRFVHELLDRAEEHDKSKLDSPEVEAFTEYTNKLAGSTYGSHEYNGFKDAMRPALEHHYAKNRHHPEHFPEGINDMTLIDLIEMFCDWKAATLRHHNGNLLKSIQINSERFKMSPQLKQIFENTAEMFDD